MMDGLVGGKAGEADGLAESRRSGAVGVRRGSVRAGQGPARGGDAHSFAAPKEQRLGAAGALALGAPTSLFGILRIVDDYLASFFEFFVS